MGRESGAAITETECAHETEGQGLTTEHGIQKRTSGGPSISPKQKQEAAQAGSQYGLIGAVTG